MCYPSLPRVSRLRPHVAYIAPGDRSHDSALQTRAPQPWPGIARTVHGDHERYISAYFSQLPGRYFTGDGAVRDRDGDIAILGRTDDVINVSGHRLSTVEVESALTLHKAVAEAAVVGFPHKVRSSRTRWGVLGLWCVECVYTDAGTSLLSAPEIAISVWCVWLGDVGTPTNPSFLCAHPHPACTYSGTSALQPPAAQG